MRKRTLSGMRELFMSRVVREDLPEEVIFEQRPKEVKEQGILLKESFLGEGTASVKTKRRNVSYL